MSDFDEKSLKWAEAAVSRALPCPFCGERLIVKTDHHGAWLAHRNEFGTCYESTAQIMDEDGLKRWNTRASTSPAPSP